MHGKEVQELSYLINEDRDDLPQAWRIGHEPPHGVCKQCAKFRQQIEERVQDAHSTIKRKGRHLVERKL